MLKIAIWCCQGPGAPSLTDQDQPVRLLKCSLRPFTFLCVDIWTMSSVRELKSYKAFRYFCSKTGNGIWSLTNNPKFSGSKGCVKRCQKETAGRGKQFGVLEIILHLNIELLTLYMYSKNLNTIVFRMSDTVIRLIERRSVGDKYILVSSTPSPSPFPSWPLFSFF